MLTKSVAIHLMSIKGRFGKGSNRYSNCQTRTMAANKCWISVEVKRRSENASTTAIIAVKREESFGSLLGRFHSQNPAESIEKTVIDLVVQ